MSYSKCPNATTSNVIGKDPKGSYQIDRDPKIGRFAIDSYSQCIGESPGIEGVVGNHQIIQFIGFAKWRNRKIVGY